MKVKTQEESAKDLTIDPKSVPEKMSFEEMKKSVEEFKRLQKIIKALPKEEKAKLLPPVRAREIPENLQKLAELIFKSVNTFEEMIKIEFSNSVTTDKPEGNKSISLTSDICHFSIAIIRKSEKKNSDKKE